jgi:hypothetical protein
MARARLASAKVCDADHFPCAAGVARSDDRGALENPADESLLHFDSPDLTYQVAPWLQAQATQWQRRHFLLWDPYQAEGKSLIGQTQPGAAYRVNWLLFLAPLKNGSFKM